MWYHVNYPCDRVCFVGMLTESTLFLSLIFSFLSLSLSLPYLSPLPFWSFSSRIPRPSFLPPHIHVEVHKSAWCVLCYPKRFRLTAGFLEVHFPALCPWFVLCTFFFFFFLEWCFCVCVIGVMSLMSSA